MIEKFMQFENGYMGNVVPLEQSSASRPSLSDRIKAAS
jgi:hypothetical protein